MTAWEVVWELGAIRTATDHLDGTAALSELFAITDDLSRDPYGVGTTLGSRDLRFLRTRAFVLTVRIAAETRSVHVELLLPRNEAPS